MLDCPASHTVDAARLSAVRLFQPHPKMRHYFRSGEPGSAKGYVKGRGMRAVIAVFLAALLGVQARAAHAQDFAPTPPIAPADMFNYCVYAGMVYSVGSQICIVRGGPPLYCEQRPADTRTADARSRASWTTNQPPGTINCASDPMGAAPNRP
jgi:hypothetical protein